MSEFVTLSTAFELARPRLVLEKQMPWPTSEESLHMGDAAAVEIQERTGYYQCRQRLLFAANSYFCLLPNRYRHIVKLIKAWNDAGTTPYDVKNLTDLQSFRESSYTATTSPVFAYNPVPPGGYGTTSYKAISAFADYGATVAGTVKATSATHGRLTGDSLTIFGSAYFDGTYTITKIDTDNFYFEFAWPTGYVATTGYWEIASVPTAVAFERYPVDASAKVYMFLWQDCRPQFKTLKETIDYPTEPFVRHLAWQMSRERAPSRYGAYRAEFEDSCQTIFSRLKIAGTIQTLAYSGLKAG